MHMHICFLKPHALETVDECDAKARWSRAGILKKTQFSPI